MTRHRSFAPSTGTFVVVPEENEKSEPFSNRKQVRIFLVWWSIVHSTRTQHFLTGDRFGIIREVEIEYDPVIKDVDRVDRRRAQAAPPRGPRAGTRTRPSRLLRPSRNCPHQCSQSSPSRAAARTTRRWRASSAGSRRSSGTAGTGRTGPPPASSRSSGAGSVDTIRRGAAMRSVAARRPSSAPRWEGPRNGPRNRPQSPFLPLWDSFLLGRACP